MWKKYISTRCVMYICDGMIDNDTYKCMSFYISMRICTPKSAGLAFCFLFLAMSKPPYEDQSC